MDFTENVENSPKTPPPKFRKDIIIVVNEAIVKGQDYALAILGKNISISLDESHELFTCRKEILLFKVVQLSLEVVEVQELEVRQFVVELSNVVVHHKT